MSEPSRATSGATSAASATSPSFARVRVGSFDEDDMVTLDELMDAAEEGLEELTPEAAGSRRARAHHRLHRARRDRTDAATALLDLTR